MYERNGYLVQNVFKKYFLPTIMMTMALSMGIIIDGIIVGNILGSDALAAVNLVVPVTLCFNTIIAMFGVGGSALASIAKGKRDHQRADSIFTLSLVTMLIISIAILVAGVFCIDHIVNTITKDSTLNSLVRSYASILFYGAPLLIVVPGCVYFIRADGNPNLASFLLIIANVVNLILDLVYILGFKMGIEGAALATVSGYFVGFCVLLAYFVSKKRTLHFSFKKTKRLKMAGEIAAAGIPSALGIFLLFVKIFCINSIVLATLGHSGMVAFSVCLSCLSFVSMFIAGSSQTMMPIVGTLYGEKDFAGIRFVVKRALMVVTASCIILVLLFEFFPVAVLSLFGVSALAEVQLGTEAIRVFALSLLGTGVSFTMLYYFQTIQKRAVSSTISIVQGFVVVVPSAFYLSKIWGSLGIWVSFIIAEIITFIIIVLMTSFASKRSGGKINGIFMFEAQKDKPSVLDVTIANLKKDATGLSEGVIEFCKQNMVDERVAMHVGLAVEEMAVNTIEYGYKRNTKNFIDINIRITKEEIIIGFKDDGIPFDPTEFREDEKESYYCSGIMLVKSLAKSISYSRLLGLNSTIIQIARL